MRLPVVAALFSLVACSESTEGSTPELEGLINPRQRLVTPPRVCNAGGSDARGWRLELVGTGFAPVPRDALGDAPTVELPQVALSGPDSYTLPADHLTFARPELMRLDLPTRDSTPARELAPGSYGLAVTNPLGGTATLEDALIVVPPPTLTGLTVTRTSYRDGSPLIIEGSGFRADALPLITLHRDGLEDQPLFTVSVVGDARIETEVPPGTPEGTYDVTLANPEGCAVTRPQALTFTYAKLGALSVSPSSGSARADTAITLDASPGGARFSATAGQDVYLVAPVKTAPGQTVNIPLKDVKYVSELRLTATVPTCTGFDPAPATDPACPGGVVPGGPYALVVADGSGAVGTVPASSGFTVSPAP